MADAMADGILTQAEEAKLREFQDQRAMNHAGADRQAAAQLERASTERLTLAAPARRRRLGRPRIPSSGAH